MNTVLDIEGKKNKSKAIQFWSDQIFTDYYNTYYNTLTLKGLDKEFNTELNSLIKVMGRLSESEKKAFINLLAKVIEHYLEQKIDKEIDYSFQKLFKF